MSGIVVEKLSKSFRGTPVLRSLSLAIEAGCSTAIIGASGCGKSTLLRCITGLETFDGGRVRVGATSLEAASARANARDIDERDRALRVIRSKLGLVFQGLHLFPHRTALENVIEAPMFVRGLTFPDAAARGRELLSWVGLSEFESAYPAQLSGGQQQRVAIARALAMDPDVLLMDEPTSALDPTRRRSVTNTLRGLRERGITLVVVTHEMTFAREVSERTIVIDEGAVVEEGASEDLFRSPNHPRTKALLEP